MMTSGPSVTNSIAYVRVRFASPAPQRVSMRTLLPLVQPSCCRPSRNAAKRAWPTGLSSANGVSTPMCRMCSVCSARAGSGQVAAAPPMSMMNWRRLTRPPSLHDSKTRVADDLAHGAGICCAAMGAHYPGPHGMSKFKLVDDDCREAFKICDFRCAWRPGYKVQHGVRLWLLQASRAFPLEGNWNGQYE